MKLNNNTFFHVVLFSTVVFLVLFLSTSHQPAFAQTLRTESSGETSPENTTKPVRLSERIFGDGTYNQFGFSAGAVNKGDYDTGFGFGVGMKRPLINPRLELTMSGYLWGASIDSLDVTSIGFEQALTYKRTFQTGTSFFSGIIAGYFVTNDREEIIFSNETRVTEKSNATFEAYLTYGITQPIARKRSLFAQIKYGITHHRPEIHILIGMFFRK